MTTPDELVHLEVTERVATITLDSERNRNALSTQLVTELMAHLATASGSDARAILIRSAHRVFCSGADLSEAASSGNSRGPGSGPAGAMVDVQRAIATSPKPVVVELGGPVRAGGLGIVGAADVVIAADSVTFALTEVRLALAPAVISLSLLERFSDRAAAELFLTGRQFDAAEAATAGLITRAVPDDDLATAVAAVVDELAEAYPQGLRETKKLLNHDLVARIDALGEHVAALSGELFGSDEAREAMTAFLERRKS